MLEPHGPPDHQPQTTHHTPQIPNPDHLTGPPQTLSPRTTIHRTVFIKHNPQIKPSVRVRKGVAASNSRPLCHGICICPVNFTSSSSLTRSPIDFHEIIDPASGLFFRHEIPGNHRLPNRDDTHFIEGAKAKRAHKSVGIHHPMIVP